MPRTILIVDDLAANRRILASMLSADYAIREAANGEAALALLESEGATVSAVLLDVSMPGMDGFEVLRHIRSHATLTNLPVIMITGSDDEQTRTKALTFGANDFVMKPYRREVILHCLRNNIALSEAAATVNALQRDRLTGLYTREAFFEKVHRAVSAHEPGHYIMACFDIDRFKVINDQYGMQKGDQILQHIAAVFRTGFLPEGGIVSRISADIFAVLYPATLADSETIDRIRRETTRAEGVVMPITFSIGRYVVDDVTLTPAAMYDRAVLAARSVKGRYDAKIAVYDEAMRGRLLREQEIVSDMETALHTGQFEVWYQPQFNHSTDAMIGAEALVRWRHPVRGLIPPAEFIPLFEQNGFVYTLDEYVWEEVCRRLKRWRDEGRNPLPVSVNISRYDALRPDLADVISDLVNKYALPMDLLRLEITETAFASSSQQIVDVVKRLIRRGFTVEIDDFGSGYSSLNTLKDVPAQIIKLDMKFLEEGSDSTRGGNIVESVVRMAKWLGISIIAEGVETRQQADYLRSIGCSYMQGYLYAHPMPAAEYEAHCRSVTKEERLLTLETVENLDNNAFWDPASMDTLIFNSFVGNACIFEAFGDRIELLRATEKYARIIGNDNMTVEDVLKLDLTEHLDAETRARIIENLAESVRTRSEVTDEYVFLDLPGCPRETHLRSTFRVIARAGERRLVYCTNENITAQRKAERLQRDIAERMQSVMDNVDSGICAAVFNGEKTQYLFVNERYYGILGYTRAQFEEEVGSVFDLIHPDDRQRVIEAAQAVNRIGEAVTLEYRVTCRDGREAWLRVAVSTRRFEGVEGPVQVSVVSDITAEKLAAEQLDAIMRNMSGGVTATTVGEDGRVKLLFANERYFEQLGWTKAAYEAQHTDAPDPFLPEDRDMLVRRCRAISRTGAPDNIEYRITRRDGAVRWMRSNITLMDYPGVRTRVQLAVTHDITEQTEAQQQIRSLSEQMQAIMRDVDCGITAAVLDDAGNIDILFANDRFYQIHGYTREQYEREITDKFALVYPEDREKARADTVRAYTTKTPATLEYRLVRPDGKVCWARIMLSSTTFSGIAQNVHLCIFSDITVEKEREREIRDAYAQLRTMMDDMPGGFVRLRVNADGTREADYFNDGMSALTGMTREELNTLYGAGASGRVHPDDVAVMKRFYDDMSGSSEAQSARYRLRHKQRGYIWLSVLGRKTVDYAGNTMYNLYYADADKQVREEQTRRELLDNLPGGAGIYEFNDGQMSLTYQNKSYWELVGLGEETYPDEAPMSAVHPDDIPVIMRELTAAVEQQRDVVCDIRLRHLTEGYRPVHLVGRIVYKETGGFLIYATFTPNEPQGMTYQQMLPLLLSAMMDATADLSFAKDKNFRYLSASRAFANMIGLDDPEALIGKTDFDLFPRDLAEKYRRDDELLLKTGKALVNEVESIPSEDGTPRYSSTSKYLLRDGAGAVIGLYGNGRDVTKAVVQDSQLRLVNDSIPGGIATYAFSDGRVHVVYCNDGFCKLFGGTREGLEGRGDIDPLEWVFEQDRPELQRQIRALVQNNEPMDCVFRVHVLGGGYKWISEKAVAAERRDGTVLFHGVLLNITEQQTAIEQLRISQEESNIAVQLGDGVICRYLVDERTLILPPDVAALYAFPERLENVPDGQIRQGMIAPESAGAYTGFFASITAGAKAATAIIRVQHADRWNWMEAKSTTVFSDDGRPVKAVISLHDITERLEKETIYRKWQQSLEKRPPESYTLFRCNLNNETAAPTEEGTLLFFDFDNAGRNFNERAAAYIRDCVFEEDRAQYAGLVNADILLADYVRGKRSDTIEYRELQPDGGVRWLRLTVELVEYPSSTEVEAYLMYEDVDEAKREEIRTREMSETDPLTGLLNRKTFAARVSQLIRTSGPGVRYALLMLDIDGFKQVNDVFGHGAGDETLIDIAAVLSSTTRRGDLVARLGGDEFLVLLNGIPNDRAVMEKAERICSLVHRAYSLEVQISASVGISIAPYDGTDFETLYKKADAALYHVKGSGKDGFAFYNDDMQDEHLVPEADAPAASKHVEKKRRMLIVDDSVIDYALLQNMFRDSFIIEKAKDGNSALVRLRHYGTAISVVLLDLMMPGMDGFAVLDQMQQSAELRSIPVLIVSGDESRETCLRAIRKGATDFITKPVDAELLRIRVQSAVSKAENERLRAQNCLLEIQNEERLRFESVLDSTGNTFVELNWLTGDFMYYPSISRYLLGTYDRRKLWQILLSDMVADTRTVQEMQQLIHRVAEARTETDGTKQVELRTPRNEVHRFRMHVHKLVNEFQLTHKLIIALTDLDYEGQKEGAQ